VDRCQVGQYLRRLFPGLQRRKITKNGKRSWVYRDLCVVRDGENTIPAGTVSNGSGSSEGTHKQNNKFTYVRLISLVSLLHCVICASFSVVIVFLHVTEFLFARKVIQFCRFRITALLQKNV